MPPNSPKGKLADRGMKTQNVFDRPLRKGGRQQFGAGVDDPQEPPIYPEVALDTVSSTSDDNARIVLDWLFEKTFLKAAYTEEQLVAA